MCQALEGPRLDRRLREGAVVSEASLGWDATLRAAGDRKIRIPKADELFIDIDNEQGYRVFTHLVALLPTVDSWEGKPSKSGLPHRHIVVKLKTQVSNLERIALQAILGSDRKHELLSYLANAAGNPFPSVLFE